MGISKSRKMWRRISKIFLISIIVLSSSLSAIVIDDQDWKNLQSKFSEYKTNYNRTLKLYGDLTTTYTNEMWFQRRMTAIYSNENYSLQREVKRMNRLLIMERIEKYAFLAVLVAILSKTLYEIMKK